MIRANRLSIPDKPHIAKLAVHLGLGLALGVASVLLSPQWVLVALIVLLGIALIANRPETGILAILVVTSSIVYENQLPLIPIVVGSLHIPDFILVFLCLVMVARSLMEPDFKLIRTPADGLLAAFWLVTLISSLIAIGNGTLEFSAALRGIRIGTYYLLFFVVINLIRSRAQLMLLLQGVFVIATGVAVAMIIQYLLGSSVAVLPGRVEALVTGSTDYADIARILPPGQALVYVGAVTLGIILGLDRLRQVAVLRGAQFGLVVSGLVLTFIRSFWMMAALMFGLVLALTRKSDRRRLMKWIFLLSAMLCVVGIVLLAIPDSPAQALIDAVWTRVGTVTGTQILEDSSFVWRFSEYDHAIPMIEAHPLLGIGAGARYRDYDPRMDWEQFDGRAYIHNGHLWIILQCGLIGYGFFMAWMVWVGVRGLRAWRSVAPVFVRGALLSFSLMLLVLPIGAIVDPVYMQWYWTPVIGMMTGVIEVIRRLYLPQPEEGGTQGLVGSGQ